MSFLSQVWIRERRDLRVFGRKWLRGKEIKNVEGLFTLFVRLILTPHADLDGEHVGPQRKAMWLRLLCDTKRES